MTEMQYLVVVDSPRDVNMFRNAMTGYSGVSVSPAQTEATWLERLKAGREGTWGAQAEFFTVNAPAELGENFLRDGEWHVQVWESRTAPRYPA